MATDLATLVVAMEANTARFQKEMDRVNGRLEQFARNSKRSADVAEAAFRKVDTLLRGAVVGALVAMVKHSANVASQQRALAESVGLTTSRLSALNYAARQNQVSQEELGKVLSRINVVLHDAAMGEDQAEKKLRQYGITSEMIRSGAVGTDKALGMVADRFAAMPNGFQKTALAAELFGEKLGPRMVQFLNLGSKGLEEFARKGEAAGAVLQDKVADAFAKANDRIEAFGQVLQTKALTTLAVLFNMVEANEGDKALEQLTQRIAGLTGELERLEAASHKAETGGILGALLHTDDAARIVEIRNELAALNRERDKLKQQQLDRIAGQGATPGATPVTSGPDKDTQRRMEQHARDLERVRGEVMLLNDAEGESAKMRALVNELYAKGKIPQDAYLAFLEESSQHLDELNVKTDENAERMSAAADQAARNIQSFTASMVDAALAGEDMGDAIVASLRRIAAEMLTAAILQGIGGSMQGSDSAFLQGIGKAIAGTRADGGPVAGGSTYLVGEQGPELFVPRTSGTIVPSGGWGGGGDVTVHIDARGADPSSAANLMRLAPTLAQKIKAEIYEEQRRGYAPR